MSRVFENESRAEGCLLGQLAGDSLGGLVEFWSPEEIRKAYPNGVRDLADGGTWGTIAGQATDDSEMALALTWAIVSRGEYDAVRTRKAYVEWLNSAPFDCGGTIRSALRGNPNPASESNGAMMRASPLGIWCAQYWEQENGFEVIARLAAEDAKITHPNQVCIDANILYVAAIADAIKNETAPAELYEKIRGWANQIDAPESLRQAVDAARNAPPADYVRQQGWVLIAFQNALYQLLHASNLEEGIVNTIMRGGDTDTNAAICGALLGAVYGKESVPKRWCKSLMECSPSRDNPKVRHPRPRKYWPSDALHRPLTMWLSLGEKLKYNMDFDPSLDDPQEE